MSMVCPRCAQPLALRHLEAEGGYRSAVSMRELLECLHCHVAVLSGANILDDEDAPPVPLRRSLLCRSRDASRWAGPCLLYTSDAADE